MPKHTLKVSWIGILFAVAFSTNLLAQTTVSTPIVGFRKTTLPSGSVCIVPGFVKAPVYSSSSAVSGQNFAVSGLSSGAYNESAFNDRPNYPLLLLGHPRLVLP